MLKKRSAADGEGELIDSSVWSRNQLAGNSSSASSSYHLWQKTMSMCTMVKTYWWLNALSASCECGRLMLSKVVTKPAFTLSPSSPLCCSFEPGNTAYARLEPRPRDLLIWVAGSIKAGPSRGSGGPLALCGLHAGWPSVGGRGGIQRVVANLAHCHHVLLSCHLRATRSLGTYGIAFRGSQVAEYWWSWWSTTSGGKHCPLPPKGHN